MVVVGREEILAVVDTWLEQFGPARRRPDPLE
jgi:hypothetical protein